MKSNARIPSGFERWWKKSWRAAGPIGIIALSAALSGCQGMAKRACLLSPSYRPNNIFVDPPKLSLHLQRVAVLPIAPESGGGDLPEGCAALTPVLWEQLVKAKKFELVKVEPARLREATGQPAWTGGENLPTDFLAFLRREYNCDGVLFAELTAYRAYAPLAVGWRLKLVDVHTGQILWAADEVFDTSNHSVADGVQRFTDPWLFFPFAAEPNWLAVNSPGQLGRYSAATLLDTLPSR